HCLNAGLVAADNVDRAGAPASGKEEGSGGHGLNGDGSGHRSVSLVIPIVPARPCGSSRTVRGGGVPGSRAAEIWPVLESGAKRTCLRTQRRWRRARWLATALPPRTENSSAPPAA